MLALWFIAPWLLTGLLAGAVPIVLHLIFQAVSRPEPFPTLRFLHQSMDRTSVRRHVQHWLLLVLRVAVLVLLALALAEPIGRAAGGFLGDRYAAVIVLDPSLSMRAREGAGSRFESVRAQGAALLGGARRPSAAAVVFADDRAGPEDLSASLERPRQAIVSARCGVGEEGLLPAIEKALSLLAAQSLPRKVVYVFSDLQRPGAQSLSSLGELSAMRDVQLVVVNVASSETENIAVTDLAVRGRQVVNSPLELTATVRNFGPADRAVDVSLHAGGGSPPPRRILLAAASADGSEAKVTFTHRFETPGTFTLSVAATSPDRAAGPDALPDDDTRRITLDIADRARALIVSGPSGGEPAMAPAWMLTKALDPYDRNEAPWPIVVRGVPADAFKAADLQGIDAVFLANVPSPTAVQAAALGAFVRSGRTAMIFLGPDVDVARYNAFAADLLPASLGDAVGQVGPAASAVTVKTIDTGHPYFSWLAGADKPPRPVTVQRYFRLKGLDPSARVLLRLANDQPLLVERVFGDRAGRVVLCATTVSPKWTDLPVTPLLLPLVERATVLAMPVARKTLTVTAGGMVTIEPSGPGTSVQVHVPADAAAPGTVHDVPLPAGRAARFDGTDRLGIYRWYLTGGPPASEALSGEFSVNPPASESNLTSADNQALLTALRDRGIKNVQIGRDLDSALASVQADAVGRNWWDLVLVCTLVVLLVEGLIANVSPVSARKTE